MSETVRRRRLALQREKKFLPIAMDSVRLDGKFSGYASIFNEVDQGQDAVAKGAFAASLKSQGADSVRMLFQHDPDQPIGVWEKIIEDKKGLYVEGRIVRGVSRSEEILELMRSGAIDGLSIGFKTRRAKTDPNTKVRWILSADLWEISVVTFPLLDTARISSIKSKYSPLPKVREFERWLTRDAGLSRRDARLVISDGFNALACKQDAARLETLHEKIRRATQTLNIRN
ncbi:MAG: HK97 family phage prohead protease [Pseudomonadota bacterium]